MGLERRETSMVLREELAAFARRIRRASRELGEEPSIILSRERSRFAGSRE